MIHPSSIFTIPRWTTKVTTRPSGPWRLRQCISRRFGWTLWLHGQKPWSYAGQLGGIQVSTVIHSVLVNQSVVDNVKWRTLFLFCFCFLNVVSICFMSYSRDTPRYPTLVSCFFRFFRTTSFLFSAWFQGDENSQLQLEAWLIDLQENGRRFGWSRFGHLQWAT